MAEIEKKIKVLDNFDLNEKFAYEKILLFFHSAEIALPVFEYTIPKGQIIYRSRENKDVKFFYRFDDIACPLPKIVSQFNRINRPFQSMFYCSDKIETSYSEFMEEWKENPLGTTFDVTIGFWRLLENVKVDLIFNNNKFSDLNKIKEDYCDQELAIIENFYLTNLLLHHIIISLYTC